MPNQYTEQRLIDSHRRTLIKITGFLDGNTASNNTVVDVSTLAYALNANGFIMSANTHPKTNYRTTIKHIYGDINVPQYLSLKWKGDANSSIITLGPDRFDINMDGDGMTGVLNNPEANTNGDILLSTFGATTNSSYTIFIDLKKDARDFDAGQTADPAAFNR